jgi:tRNA (cmo5U34)-methyltransferase
MTQGAESSRTTVLDTATTRYVATGRSVSRQAGSAGWSQPQENDARSIRPDPDGAELRMKSTVDEIRRRFDEDVERFSNLETGQSATIDAPLVMNLIARAAAAVRPAATRALDVGCGAGNYSLKLLEQLPGLEIDLLDLSEPMLARARERIAEATPKLGRVHHGDVREVPLEPERYDIVVAAATLHHLRSDEEWTDVFRKLYRSIRPGGCLWISDLVEHSSPAIQTLMRARYGEYLAGLKGEAYRDEVFAYIEKEDSPRPLMYQIELLREVGFGEVEVLHKNSVFAAFGGVRPR